MLGFAELVNGGEHAVQQFCPPVIEDKFTLAVGFDLERRGTDQIPPIPERQMMGLPSVVG
jgi:hypothetical protein